MEHFLLQCLELWGKSVYKWLFVSQLYEKVIEHKKWYTLYLTIFFQTQMFRFKISQETKRKQSYMYDLPAVWVQDSWTPSAPSALPWPGFGEHTPPSPHGVYSGLAFFSLIREGGGQNNRNDGCKLQTVYDSGLVTHLWVNPPKQRDSSTPTSPPGFFYRPCLFTALCTQFHSSQLFLPLSFYHFFQFLLFISLTPGQFCGHFVLKKDAISETPCFP